MIKQPVTHFHKLQEMCGADVDELAAAPKFTFEYDVVELLSRVDAQRSIAAMMQAGICRAPHPELVVEFSVGYPVRRFVLLKEMDGLRFSAKVASRAPDWAVVTATEPVIAVSEDALRVSGHNDENEGYAVAFAVSLALLMLNIRGLEHEVVAGPPALNVKRVQRGLPTVPDVSLVRIGKVYDREGTAKTFAKWRMPVHWRSAHTRMVACGENWQDHRPKFIPACLINWSEDDDVPAPRSKVILK